ncbi:cytochrome P450 [Bradyrhizobium sp. CB82]|uniref:cytochrome P450 n=1 Tax=Bradyrhizobium sp. CB82 TaxID=3039159 RepID=UPI0024B275E6|nr:cytochrome P450 [Bradyrhizobium sp. CB82]WFU43464.1 cytochrome P450 [Bradyrhizobium sp. CB82]
MQPQQVKYYEKIREAEAASANKPPSNAFDWSRLKKGGVGSRITTWLLAWHPLYRVLRFLPILKLWGVYVVTRYDDVKMVRARQDVFEVPYGPEMTELTGGASFLLGMPPGRDYDRQKAFLTSVLKTEDIQRTIVPTTSSIATELVEISGGQIDVIEDLVIRVPAEVCAAYFGLDVDDPQAFAEWLMAISTLLFADYHGDPVTRELALTGAQRVKSVIHRSLGQARVGTHNSRRTLVDRFIAMQVQADGPTDDEIAAMLLGLAVGFVPTNTLAAAHILSILFEKTEAMQQAASAAREDNDEELESCLIEALRFRPPIVPGLPRYAKQPFILSKDRWWPTTIPKDGVVLAAIMSAMLDRSHVDQPEVFDPGRQLKDDLAFGGMGLDHYCLGEQIARAQITQTLKPLLRQSGLHRVGQEENVGPFPRHLTVQFAPKDGQRTQSMITICIPMAGEADHDAVAREIASLGNPAKAPIRTALDETQRIHFASLNVIKGEMDEPSYVVFELNVDGPEGSAIDAACEKAERQLLPIFQLACGIGDLEALKRCLHDNVVHSKATPLATRHVTSGLNFSGTPELAVTRIDQERKIANVAYTLVTKWVQQNGKLALPAMPALRFTRDELLRSGTLRHRLVRPLNKPLAISRHADLGRLEAVKSFLTDRSLIVTLAALTIGMGLLRFLVVWHGRLIQDWLDWAIRIGSFLISLVDGLLYVGFLVLLVLSALVLLLRRQEAADPVEDLDPGPIHLQELLAVENPPGYVQNHLTAITPLKAGWLRRLTLAAAFWGINKLVKHRFRPGFILDIGTIHFARWFRLPKTGRLVFLANYDGSWESYLEDFITKAHYGQTAVWSNGRGFPRTRFLILDGAEDGARFKRWVRRQQVPTPFWYSRFPALTTDQIRNNALICYGLANARTESEARAWLDLFNSQPRPPSAIELHEIQSLVFGPLGRLGSAEMVLLRFPDDPARCRKWLQDITAMCSTVADDGELNGEPMLPLRADYELPLASTSRVSFGDVVDERRALMMAFSAAGLRRLIADKMNDGDVGNILDSFPAAFVEGMSERSRILGDLEASAPEHWKWGAGDAQQRADAILLLYATTPNELQSLRKEELSRARKFGLLPFHSIRMQDVGDPGRSREPFGFRDGISQPIIRGTKRFARDANSIHVVEPGEFVLGYADNHGYFPPTPVVPSERDLNNILPDTPANLQDRFPAFAGEIASAPRDLGRNGSFLVVRQLEQDVAGFNDFLDATAGALRSAYPTANLSAHWVAAKMVGRWRDGASLIRHPEGPAADEDNDFLPGVEDPQGLRCPYGAHIRRANPRDSLQPGSEEQIKISNRHRIVRVGRPYVEGSGGEDPVGDDQRLEARGVANGPGNFDKRGSDWSTQDEGTTCEASQRIDSCEPKGLLFMCLNADIERQFEFLQQTWISSPSFHGLKDERDPLVGTSGPGKTGTFTVPTTVGPLEITGLQSFVTVKGGGYFFLPSRSALRFLSQGP